MPDAHVISVVQAKRVLCPRRAPLSSSRSSMSGFRYHDRLGVRLRAGLVTVAPSKRQHRIWVKDVAN